MIAKRWKFIKGYNYKISNYGEVYSIKSKRNLKPYKNLTGRSLLIQLSKNGNSKVFSLSKLIIKYFNEDWTLTKQYALHLDYNRENNIETNLSCATRGNLLRYWHRYRNKVKGIYKFNNGLKKYRAMLKYNNKVITVGYYRNYTDALFGYYNAYFGLYKIEPFII